MTRVHRLICEWAHGPAPDGKPHALHSCDRPICCNPDHLRWGSNAENRRDSVARGRQSRGEARYNAKLTEADVKAIRRARARGASNKEQAARYGVDGATISLVSRYRKWKHVR